MAAVLDCWELSLTISLTVVACTFGFLDFSCPPFTLGDQNIVNSCILRRDIIFR